MIEYIREKIKNKSVLLLGFGREGQSSLRMLLAAGGAFRLAVADKAQLCEKDVRAALETPAQAADPAAGTKAVSDAVCALGGTEGILLHCGADYQKCIDGYDLVLKSPGIVLEREIGSYKAEISSQTALVLACFREQIIGVTGTKGKSTTTTLLYHILKEAGMPVILAGNIGIPVFDVIGEMTPETLLLLELSCHQLEFADISPKRGILLNIYEEHLDHYGTMERYAAAKKNIYVNQLPGDILYAGQEVLPEKGCHRGECVAVAADGMVDITKSEEEMEQEPPVCGEGTLCERVRGQVSLCGSRIFYGERSLTLPTEEIRLLGAHNYLDIAFVYALCCDLGILDGQFLSGLKTYVPLPHRLQLLGNYDGVFYYDDSISTIDETTIQALNTIPNVDTVLIGGMERDISYRKLEEYLSASGVAHIILMEETGRRIYEEICRMDDFAGKERLALVEHLEEAVALAKRVTRKGGSCVLSPAAASYGIFKGFEERGECFAKLVRGRE